MAPQDVLRILLPLLLAACWPASTRALGVGEPQLLSGYAEPLRVRVPVLLDSADERGAADELRAELVPTADYHRYGVAEQGIDVSGLYAASRSSVSGTWIEIGSARPMHEPAAILLLRVRLGSTAIVREVPLLFDAGTPATPAEAVPVAEPAAPQAARPAVGPPRAHASKPHHIHARRQQTALAPVVTAPLSQPDSAPVYTSVSTGLHLAESFDSLARRPLGQTQAAASPKVGR